MRTMRYQTYRRVHAFGSLLLIPSLIAPAFLRSEWLGFAYSIVFWSVVVVFLTFHLAVVALRAAGKLEFTYTDADRRSYLYNADVLYQQMKATRTRKR